MWCWGRRVWCWAKRVWCWGTRVWCCRGFVSAKQCIVSCSKLPCLVTNQPHIVLCENLKVNGVFGIFCHVLDDGGGFRHHQPAIGYSISCKVHVKPFFHIYLLKLTPNYPPGEGYVENEMRNEIGGIRGHVKISMPFYSTKVL